MELQKMFIDGSWVEGSGGKSAPTYNPANGEILAMMTEGTEEDVKKAVAAAKKSFYETREWRDMDVQVRSDMILKIADAIEAEKDVFAKLDCLDLGKPLREAEADVDDAIHCFRYYAGAMKTPCGGYYEVNEGFGKMHTYTIHEPVGVCGLITPWNYPLLMGVWKLAPALAAGNSVVFKPSSNCVLSSVHLFEIFEKVGLPKGCANLVLGPGSVVGNTLAGSEDVDMITFTGSTEVGQSIMRAAAGNIKKIGLELGGKSPNVIFADADLDGAVEWAMIGIFLNQGEVCAAGSRIIIEKSIKDRFLEKLIKKTKAMTIGDPMKNPDIGPLVTEGHMKKVLDYIDKGVAEGAKLVCGGKRYTEGECANGYYVLPTIFDGCTSDMTIVKEEIFGPVVTIQTFETEQEAIDLANETEYGLAGAVFTTDGARALRVIREIRPALPGSTATTPLTTRHPGAATSAPASGVSWESMAWRSTRRSSRSTST